MKPITRIMTSITAQFNNLVLQIENHEAVAEATLKQFHKDICSAKVKLKLIEREVEEIENKITSNKKEVKRWQERARKYGDVDRDKALHCVKQIQLCESEEESLQLRFKNLNESALQMKSKLNQLEDQLKKYQVKFKTYTFRDQVAGLNQQSKEIENSVSLSDVFGRWEKQILEKEIDIDAQDFAPENTINREIFEEEDRENLEMALDELLNNMKQGE